MKHPITPRTALAVAALAAVTGLAACGGDDKSSDTSAGTQATATATATATASATGTQPTTATSTEPVQREAVVPGKEEKLKVGDNGLNIKVLKVLDPAAASVDRAQPGKKLVGVFVEGKSDSAVEAAKTSAITTLQTTDGKVTGIRIIADGDCGGGFSAGDLLQATDKPATGCIGFEIPKKATPESITIILTNAKGSQQATWKLPKAQ